MRLTTKIIIGIFVSIFILSLLFIIGFSFTERKNFNKTNFGIHVIKLPQENKKEVNTESSRVIVLTVQTNDKNRFTSWYSNEESGLFIRTASATNEENKLFIPEALKDFIAIQTNQDTLIVKIKMDEVLEKYGYKDEALGIREAVQISGFNLCLYTSNVNVINKIRGIQTRISNLEADSIKIYSAGDVIIDSCKANVIEPESGRKLTVSNSAAKVLNLDLDQTTNWNINNCDIAVRNYTGSKRYHTLTFSRPESGTINWQPKNNESELNIKIKGDSAQISIQM